MIPSIAGEQPKLCRSAACNPSSRWLRSQERHSDENATAPPDSAFPVVFRDRYVLATRVRLWAVQVAPIFRIPPRNFTKSCNDANETCPSSLKLATVAYGYESAVCAKISTNPCAFGR
jgi:hypothetical protein